MKQRVFSAVWSFCLLCLAVLLLTAVMPATAHAAEAQLSEDGLWSFSACEGGVEVTAYHGEAADVYIPATVKAGGTPHHIGTGS